ncbi:two-component regulator propeller domain-containing protein [Salegentibacter sp. F188]|uniref:histidine kinase n=1 Tax=Autumnicola patrickiae TaxID=3075591 RepID=A0ABU3E1W7_9FLAO|nr:two-component regulator propeller domain-containing protein [Salegentibacter sp. F188]MDT0689989.1 two-component regulator propeller domain-containing protein [Salegentibacter sp. F188]
MSFGQEKHGEPDRNNDDLSFHLLNISSGLSHNFVNDIAQDSLGFIWIATIDGLNRYDGNRFIHYKGSYNDSLTGLTNNYVEQLKFKSSGELLIATDEGLNIYNFRKDKFTVVSNQDGLLTNSVSALALGPDGNPIIGTYRGGIQFAKKDWNIQTIKEKFGKDFPLSSSEISSMTMQGDSILWIGTFNNGLNKFSYKTNTIIHLNSGEENFSFSTINNLYTDLSGNLWIGSREGLEVITGKGDTIKLNKGNSPSKSLSDDDILCFEEDDLGQMWIGTRNGGLNIINIASLIKPDQDPEIKWFLPGTDGSSVYNRTVSVITRDRDNNMWLGTPTGINYVNPGGEPIKLIQRNVSATESLSHDRIGALARSNNNMIWVGTDGGGLDLYNSETGEIKNFNHKENNSQSLSNNYIISVLEDSNNRVWVGTYQGGLNKLDKRNDTWTHYLQGSPSEGSDVREIFESRNNSLWVGTNRGGLYKYNAYKDQFDYIQSLGKIDIRDIDEDCAGNLWLATFGSGIIKYDPIKDTVVFFNQDNLEGLSTNVVFSITVLNNKDILAGTRYGGLLRFDPEKKEVKTFTEREGLSNNTVSSMVMEDENLIWLGTYNGICRYNVQTNEILNISSMNNVQNGEFNIGAAIKSATGKIYIGGNNGLNILNPEDFGTKNSIYPIVFEELKILNESAPIGSKKEGYILEEAIPFQKEIVLQHNQNSFSVDFAALKYPEAKNINYSYKLENYNDFWIDTQGSGVANFTSVPPGEYNLVVKTNSGMGEEAFQNLLISIVPPFWKTLPAYILYILIIAIILWLSSRYYTERVHLRNSLIFEKKQRQLEHDLNEERLRFFTAFSHELKTPLTLILAPVENLISKERNEDLKQNLLFIRRNAKKLFQSINKLLEFRKAEEGLSQLNCSNHDLPGNLLKWVQNYLPLAKEKDISLEHSLPQEKILAYIDLEKIEVIVNNLLSNAIKYCKKGGRVKVVLSIEEVNFKIQVSDTGTGITSNDLTHIFDWYYRSDSTVKKNGTGIGLALSKRFAELHNGDIMVSSVPQKETIFTLSIPIVKNSVSNKLSIIPEEISGEIYLKENFVPGSTPGKKNESITSDKNRPLILIIDDNPEILVFLNGIFKEDYDIVHATNGDEGIRKASKYVPDIIISDVMMPEKNGIDLCSGLKKQTSTSHIPIILLTAKNNIESISTGYEEGADDYITKPFHPQLLMTRVKNLLENRRQLQNYFLKNTDSSTIDNKTSKILNQEKQFLHELDQVILKNMGTGKDNVELIAKEVGMSRTSLYRKLKAITGNSINEYIRNVKIERAAKLIEVNNFSISQASYEVGFNNVKYFRKVFKEKYGKLPSELKH